MYVPTFLSLGWNISVAIMNICIQFCNGLHVF